MTIAIQLSAGNFSLLTATDTQETYSSGDKVDSGKIIGASRARNRRAIGVGSGGTCCYLVSLTDRELPGGPPGRTAYERNRSGLGADVPAAPALEPQAVSRSYPAGANRRHPEGVGGFRQREPEVRASGGATGVSGAACVTGCGPRGR